MKQRAKQNKKPLPQTLIIPKSFSPSQSIEYKKILFIKIMQEIRQRVSEYAIRDFSPLPSQRAFMNSHAKITMLLGGNRSGKTTAGIANLVLYVLDMHPYYRLPPKAIVWVVGLDSVNHINPILVPRILEYVPKSLVEGYDKMERKLSLHNGCTIYFKSCESGVGKFQSAAVNFLWFDEEPSEEVWRESYARTIDKSAPIFITMTPVNGVSWSYKEIFTRHDGDNVNVVIASLVDNIHLPKQEVQDFLARLDDSERLVRVEGRYVSFGSKRIFPKNMVDEKVFPTVKKPIALGDIYNNNFIASNNEKATVKIYAEPNGEFLYVLGADTSEGIDDPTAIVVLGYNPDRKQIFTAATFCAVIPPEQIHSTILALSKLYFNPLAIIERNSTGSAVIDRLKPFFLNLYVEEKKNLYGNKLSNKHGWYTDIVSKTKMIRDAKELLQSVRIDINSDQIAREIDDYIEDKRGKSRGATGHDDMLIAWMLCLQAMLSTQFSHEVFNYERAEVAKHNREDAIKPRYSAWMKY